MQREDEEIQAAMENIGAIPRIPLPLLYRSISEYNWTEKLKELIETHSGWILVYGHPTYSHDPEPPYIGELFKTDVYTLEREGISVYRVIKRVYADGDIPDEELYKRKWCEVTYDDNNSPIVTYLNVV